MTAFDQLIKTTIATFKDAADKAQPPIQRAAVLALCSDRVASCSMPSVIEAAYCELPETLRDAIRRHGWAFVLAREARVEMEGLKIM